MAEADRDRILAGCDDEQRAAITSPSAPLLVIAGAGAGKTRVLTRRIAWRIADQTAASGHVLALTFTRKAATELRDRLRVLGVPAPVTAGTFHSVALAQLRSRALDDGRTPPAVLESKARVLGRILSGQRTTGALSRRSLVSEVASEIEWAKARRVGPDSYAAEASRCARRTSVPAQQVASLFAAYEQAKVSAGLVDFEDLLDRLADDIQNDRSFAAVQRWRFQHLFVDELQDANAAQLRLLDAWLGENDDLFAVGDARQAIYGWNGADPSAVTRFTERYPGASVMELRTNYRSTPQVVTVASAVFGPDEPSQLAPSPDGPLPTVTAYESELHEAAGVASKLRARRTPGPWSSCAVLARTNAQLAVLEEALTAVGIPFRSPTNRLVAGDESIRAALGRLDRSATRAGLVRWLNDLIEDETLSPDSGGDDERPEPGLALAALIRLATEYLAADPAPSGSGFLDSFRQASSEGALAEGRDGVDLLTFHRAKGLEWPVVFVTGVEAGYLPIAHARARDDLDEERRLFYVALSRATAELHCSWAKSRSFGGRPQQREPSPYLEDVAIACRALARAERFDPARAKAALASVRELLGSPEQ